MLTPRFNNFLTSLAGAPTLSGVFESGGPQTPAPSGQGESFAQQLALLLAALPAGGQVPPGPTSSAKTAHLSAQGLAQVLELLQTQDGLQPPQGVREWLKGLLAEGPAQWPGRDRLQELLEAGEAIDPGALLEAVAACLPQTFAGPPVASAQTPPEAAPAAAPEVVPETAAPQGQQPPPADRPPSLTDVPNGAPRPWWPAEQPPSTGAPEHSPPQAAAGPAQVTVAAPEAETAQGEGQSAPAAGPGSPEVAQVSVLPEEELPADDHPLGREVARAVREAIERVKAAGTATPVGPEVAQAAHEVLAAHGRGPQARTGRQPAGEAAPRPQAAAALATPPDGEGHVAEAAIEGSQAGVQAKEPAANPNQTLAGALGQEEGPQAPEVSLEAAQTRLAAEADQGLARPNATPRPEPAPELVRQVATQVARALQQGVHQGAERLRLRLKPPELGELHLDLKLRGTDLRVTLVAETGAAREALQAGMAELRGSLAEQGLRLEECHVFVRQDGGAFAFQGREHPNGPPAQNQPGGAAAGGPPEPGAELLASRPTGRIDLFC